MYADSIAQEDLLGRKEFSKKIAFGLLNSSNTTTDGFVVSLTGKWGTGKSTLLSYIKQDLNLFLEEGKVEKKFIEFNPWMFTDEENIKKAFLKKLLESIQDSPILNAVIKKSKRVARFFKRIGILKTPSNQVLKDLSGLLENYLDNNSSSYLKNQIDKILVQNKIKLFVFIDDIDRLNPKQIFEIFQILKLTCNFQNTYYVIAFDREAVEIAIESQFKDYGKKYLDKIIQADFVIPSASQEKIEQIFFGRLESVVKQIDENLNISRLSSIWLHQGLKYFFLTLRDVYRFINSVELTLPHIYNDIDVIDFIILETIRLYDFDGYERIYSEYSQQLIPFEPVKRITSEEILQKFSDNRTKRLIKYLFPHEEHPLDIRMPNSKRLCDPSFFERYFTFKVNSTDVAEIEFRQIVSNNNNRKEILKNILRFGRLKNLIVRLNDTKINETYNDWDFKLISDLYHFFEDFPHQLETYANSYSDAILNLLVSKEKEIDIYFNLFKELLLESPSKISFPKIYFLHYIILDKDHNTGFSHNAYYFKQYYLEQHMTLKANYIEYLKQWSNYFISPPIPEPLSLYTNLFLYDFSRFFSDEYKNALPTLIKNEKSLIFFLRNILGISSSDNQASRIYKERINTYLPDNFYHDFLIALKGIDITSLSSDQKQWREFLLEENDKLSA